MKNVFKLAIFGGVWLLLGNEACGMNCQLQSSYNDTYLSNTTTEIQNSNYNNNSNWDDYLVTPDCSRDDLNLQHANNDENNDLYYQNLVDQTDKYDEYENISRKFKNRIPQMNIEEVKWYLVSVELEIQECEKNLNDILTMPQATDHDNSESVNQLEIEDLMDQINNFKDIRDLLQNRKQELENQTYLKDQMIYITKEILPDNNDTSSTQ